MTDPNAPAEVALCQHGRLRKTASWKPQSAECLKIGAFDRRLLAGKSLIESAADLLTATGCRRPACTALRGPARATAVMPGDAHLQAAFWRRAIPLRRSSFYGHAELDHVSPYLEITKRDFMEAASALYSLFMDPT